jgi:nucleosome assembly protein 1-like 1
MNQEQTFNLSSLKASLQTQDTVFAEMEDMKAFHDEYNKLKVQNIYKQYDLDKSFNQKCLEIFAKRSEAVKQKSLDDFWLKALLNNRIFADAITEMDEEPLKFLKDIKCEYFSEGFGYHIDFVFDINPFFENHILRKSYYLTIEENEGIFELMFEKSTGTDIKWVKNLCYKEESKTQRHRNTGELRTVVRSVKSDSFFHYFESMPLPDFKDAKEEELDSLEYALQEDFAMGDTLKEKIIPNALAWYLGTACDSDDEQYDGDDEEEAVSD